MVAAVVALVAAADGAWGVDGRAHDEVAAAGEHRGGPLRDDLRPLIVASYHGPDVPWRAPKVGMTRPLGLACRAFLGGMTRPSGVARRAP